MYRDIPLGVHYVAPPSLSFFPYPSVELTSITITHIKLRPKQVAV